MAVAPPAHVAITLTDIVTALSTFGLLIVGGFGLRNLGIAARALQVETDPVIVIEELRPQEISDPKLEADWDILVDHNGMPTFRDMLNPPARSAYPILDSINSLLPGVTLRVRNVGRSAAVGLRLIAHIAIGGQSNGLSIPITFIAANEERFIHFRNVTNSKVFLKLFSVADHRPEDGPSLLYLRGYFALRLRLVKLPGFANTALYRWMLQRREQPHKSLYVYCPSTILIRAPGTKPTPAPETDLLIEEL